MYMYILWELRLLSIGERVREFQSQTDTQNHAVVMGERSSKQGEIFLLVYSF